MKKLDWAQVEELFATALELPLDERQGYLQAASEEQPALVQEVRSLLGSFDSAHTFFEQYAEELHRPLESSPLPPGTRLGPYEIGAEIGRGGMSVVYQAKRVDGTYQETVAIKVLKKGLDTSAILRRFRHEQQLLVELRHPHIANLLDGGESEAGQPYLVMEYISGKGLLETAQQQALPQRERLRLFLQMVSAVQHAHQRLVVHRDLKPSNILLTESGEVKLLDFGIAKLLTEDSAQSLLLTQAGQRWLTPQYAAPEQLTDGPISTATDVYQLGLILQELLEDSDSLPGELSDIVAMALRPEPERRYASARELGQDIEAYLHARPIQARPESWTYLLRKFVQRNRLGVAAAVLLGLSLLGGIIGTSWQAKRAQAALIRETAERKKAEAITNFLISLFQRTNPYETQDTLPARDMPLQAFLDQSLTAIRSDLTDQPEVQMELLEVMGKLYNNLSLKQKSYELGKEVLRLTEGQLGRSHPAYASRVHHLAGAASDLDRFEEADSLFQLALTTNKAAFGTQPRHLAVVYNDYGVLKDALRDPEAADSLFQRALYLMRLNGISDTANYAQTLHGRSDALQAMGHTDSAYVLIAKAQDLLKQAGLEGTIFMAHSQNQMGKVLVDLGRLPEALAVQKQAEQGFRLHLGPRSHFVALSLYQQSKVYAAMSAFAQEKELLEAAIDILTELYGTETVNHAVCQLSLALAKKQLGQTNEAEQLMQEAQRKFVALGVPQMAEQAQEKWDAAGD